MKRGNSSKKRDKNIRLRGFISGYYEGNIKRKISKKELYAKVFYRWRKFPSIDSTFFLLDHLHTQM